jgi:hypothetical protein
VSCGARGGMSQSTEVVEEAEEGRRLLPCESVLNVSREFNKVSPMVAYVPLECDASTQPRRNPSFCALADLARDWRVDRPNDNTKTNAS